ncbi:MAG: hypothetical protein EPO22_01035 [Dehalococcoidia bacterium]|nr:MAG: hypothetical protein EPO22_01035 [Dehalococcoidia bacterium]
MALVASCALVAGCGGGERSETPPTATTATQATGLRVVYLVGYRSAASGAPIFHLMSVGSSGSQRAEIAQFGAVNQTFSIDPNGRRAALVTDITDTPELLIVDLASGQTTRATDSQGGDDSVVLGPQDMIAYCDSQGRFRAGSLSDVTATAVIETHPRAGACPHADWRIDSTLAFLAESPLSVRSPRILAEALYIRDSNGTMSQIDLPGVYGFGQVDWSADGTRVALAAGDSIVVVDVASGQVQPFGRGTDPAYAPDEPRRLAARRWDEQKRSVDVWQDDAVVASLPGDYAGFAWCPGGNEIAATSPDAVSLWNWRTGEKRILARANLANYQFIQTSVTCF